MAISKASMFSSFLCFLLITVSLAQTGQESQRGPRGQSECGLDKLSALQPSKRIDSEAGFTEYFDDKDPQLQCAGLTALRCTIQTRGLLLTSYISSPAAFYIIQGEGVCGVIRPGCPETYQSFQQTGQQEQQGEQISRDEHQQVFRFRQGDFIALPAGMAHWCYNDGQTPLVGIAVLDTSNNANQLDRNPRQFHLAGSPKSGQEKSPWASIFNGFDLGLLAEALGVSREVAEKIQSQRQQKGDIVLVEKALQFVHPPRKEESQGKEGQKEETQGEEGQKKETQGKEGTAMNGVEQVICNMKVRENIDDPTRADIYSSQSGRITNLNSQKLPILRYIQLSAERGVLLKNAILAPHSNLNAHSAMFVTGGRAKVQIVDNRGRRVFDGELRQGQLLVIPQHFVVIKQARGERFEWISFKTNDNAIVTQINGKGSVLSATPVDVIMNSYPGMSREEARMVQSSRRDHVAIFPPRSQQGRADAYCNHG